MRKKPLRKPKNRLLLKLKNKLPQRLRLKQILKLKLQLMRKKLLMPRKRLMLPQRRQQKVLTTCLMASLTAKMRRRVVERLVHLEMLVKLAQQVRVIVKRVELPALILVTMLDRSKRRLKASFIRIQVSAEKYVTCVLSSRQTACC